MESPSRTLSTSNFLTDLEQICNLEKMNQRFAEFNGHFYEMTAEWKLFRAVTALALTVIAAYVYKQSRPVIAIGTGLLALAVGVTSYETRKSLTKDAQELKDLFTRSVEGLQALWKAKSETLCNYINQEKEDKWNTESVQELSNAYDNPENINITMQNKEQSDLRQIHAEAIQIVQNVANIDLAANDRPFEQNFKRAFGQFQRAVVQVIHGNCPPPEDGSYVKLTLQGETTHATTWIINNPNPPTKKLTQSITPSSPLRRTLQRIFYSH